MYKGGNNLSAFMRKFVILEEQPSYYKKVQGITPKGHMNIEIRDGRGKLIINVENLKAAPNEEKLYKACLVGVSDKGYVDVDLGVIVLNDKGRGSIEWKFDPVSVGGTSLSIDKFNNILVKEVDMTNDSNDVIVPLSGYIYKKDGSLVKLMKKQSEKEFPRKQEIQKQDTEKIQLAKSKVDNKKIIEEVNTENDLQQPEIRAEQVQEDTYVPSAEEFNIEEASIEEEKIEPANLDSTVEEEQEELEEIKKDMYEEAKDSFKPFEAGVNGLNVEELYFDDIIPLNLAINDFEQVNMDIGYDKLEEQNFQELDDIQKVQEVFETQEENEIQEIEEAQGFQEEVEEQAEATGTIWIDLETGEEVEEEQSLIEENFIEVNDILQDDFQNDDFIRMGDDLENYFMHLQNNQVTYNYGDYIDNTYGNKINKIDPYMDTAKNYSMQVANYTMDILKFFDKVEPFSENLRDCTWWRIEHNSEDINRGFLPFYNYLVNVYYPYPLTSKTTTCQSMIEKYSHYIFGTVKEQEEVKYYVYGVPGRFTIAEHPYNGATGFNTWLKDKNSTEDLGYWLIYIDALSGKIVNPVNPTMPTI